jgi:antitoxin ParD1/3/4
MPIRTVSLTLEQDAFIEEMVEAGEYSDASEAMRDALLALQQSKARRAHDELRFWLEQGVAALDQGKYTEIADESLDEYLDNLAMSAGR